MWSDSNYNNAEMKARIARVHKEMEAEDQDEKTE